MTEVVQATTPAELDAVRALMRGFVAWHRQVHADLLPLVERYFDAAAFNAELAGLPGKYAPPKGSLLLASVKGEPAGCVAMRDLGEGTCEMKRMFVYTRFHRQKVGRVLVEQLLHDARVAGHARMRLDTGPRQTAAIGLYESVGFRRIAAYYEVPGELRDWLVFMQLDLTAAG